MPADVREPLAAFGGVRSLDLVVRAEVVDVDMEVVECARLLLTWVLVR